MTPVNRTAPQFAELLSRALTEPGVVSRAYSAFHGYSLGNQILAFVQCAERGILPGPIATFMGWKDKGRYVRKGEKAIVLCLPVTCKRQPADQPQPAEAAEPGAESPAGTYTRFVYRPNWFVLSQTDGQARRASADAGLEPDASVRGPRHRRGTVHDDGRQLPGLRPATIGRGLTPGRIPAQDPIP